MLAIEMVETEFRMDLANPGSPIQMCLKCSIYFVDLADDAPRLEGDLLALYFEPLRRCLAVRTRLQGCAYGGGEDAVAPPGEELPGLRITIACSSFKKSDGYIGRPRRAQASAP